MASLSRDYFLNENTVDLAKDILGKYLFTKVDNVLTGGKIVETEAYAGTWDRACHAYNGRKTNRTRIMYEKGGVAYVYLCYGIHNLFNIVTHREEEPHAVLIRAIEPTEGIEVMMERRKKKKLDRTLTAGPGSLTKALAIDQQHNGIALQGEPVWLEDRGDKRDFNILESPRVGINYAGEHANLPYRFRIEGNQWTSKAK